MWIVVLSGKKMNQYFEFDTDYFLALQPSDFCQAAHQELSFQLSVESFWMRQLQSLSWKLLLEH